MVGTNFLGQLGIYVMEMHSITEPIASIAQLRSSLRSQLSIAILAMRRSLSIIRAVTVAHLKRTATLPLTAGYMALAVRPCGIGAWAGRLCHYSGNRISQ